MHRSAGLESAPVSSPSCSVEWPKGMASPEQWLASQPSEQWKTTYNERGFLRIENLLSPEELAIYRDLYDRMLRGEIDTSRHRHDLGNHQERKTDAKENITQIMWPTLYVQGLASGPVHQRCLLIARTVFGDDMVHDFDMMIAKAPHTDAKTPWHCDESYWLDMPDKRALSCWVAMDDTCLENGCMWFGAGSHLQPMRKHHPAAPGVHVLQCEGSEAEGTPQPLSAGWATCHGGRTLHYSRGNTTSGYRRGFIVNYRPEAMVLYERQRNYDHGQSGVTDIIGKSAEAHKEASD